MKEFKVSFDQFDFNGFALKMLEFAKVIIDQTYAVAWVNKSGDIPEY